MNKVFQVWWQLETHRFKKLNETQIEKKHKENHIHQGTV